RGGRGVGRDRPGGSRPARHARAPPLRGARRPRARWRDARRVPARARRRERRHVDPLPARAPPERLSRRRSAAAARRRARGRRGALAAALPRALRRRRAGCDRRAPPRARALRMIRKRWFRLGGTLVVTLLAGAYILSKI